MQCISTPLHKGHVSRWAQWKRRHLKTTDHHNIAGGIYELTYIVFKYTATLLLTLNAIATSMQINNYQASPAMAPTAIRSGPNGNLVNAQGVGNGNRGVSPMQPTPISHVRV